MPQQHKCVDVGSNAMTDFDDITKLNNYEDEDIFDVVVKLEKSFGLKFEKDAFYNVKTFGDMCDVFENHMIYDDRDDCTRQQAFYKIRDAIAATQYISRDEIKLDSKLEYLFPRHDRRRKAKAFRNYLATDINILTYPSWLSLTFIIGLLLSIVAFFYDWKIAVAGIVFFISAMKIADKLGKDLDLKTVRDLTDKLSKENYIDIRRQKGTINRREVRQTIVETFSKDLAIDIKYLTREEKFGWVK
jgi:hypothetical protein